MAHDDAAERARLFHAILRHVKAHPFAADTGKGILASWLPARGFENASDHMDAVLADLVAKRRLQTRRLPDGETLYVCCVDPCEE